MKKLLLLTFALALTACKTNQQTQNQTMKTEWNRNYGSADKSYDTDLLSLREKIAPKFQKFSYKDEKRVCRVRES